MADSEDTMSQASSKTSTVSEIDQEFKKKMAYFELVYKNNVWTAIQINSYEEEHPTW